MEGQQMTFVDDVKKAWRWISVQAMAAAVAVQGAWELLPDDMKAGIPPKLVTAITVALLVLGIAGRLVKQK
jgi:anti-sigma-K factor RskA